MPQGWRVKDMHSATRLACFAGVLLTASWAEAEVPDVVASIAPVHSLTAAVMAGVGEPQLLVPAEMSDHDYALKPSDVRKLSGADLVVWIGDPLETYLVNPLETEGVRNLELIDLPSLEARPFAEERADREPENGEARAKADSQERLGLDPHVWLDPVRAQAMVAAIAEALAGLDPDNAARYRQNAETAIGDLQALDREIRARLTPVAQRPFITFHDGYSYFVERYGLNQVGQITVRPEQRPGAATMRALRETVAAEGVGCAFSEPQFDADVVATLAGETGIKVGVLDAIGAGLQPGPGLYAALLRRNVGAVAACLLPNS